MDTPHLWTSNSMSIMISILHFDPSGMLTYVTNDYMQNQIIYLFIL
mgnify:CR=1 FL=1